GAAPLIALATAVFLWELIRAPIRIYRRQALALARAHHLQASPQAPPTTWLVRFPGGVSDVAVSRRRPNFITEYQRFAIAEDLTFINNSDAAVTLTVALLIQYGVTTLVREPH